MLWPSLIRSRDPFNGEASQGSRTPEILPGRLPDRDILLLINNDNRISPHEVPECACNRAIAFHRRSHGNSARILWSFGPFSCMPIHMRGLNNKGSSTRTKPWSSLCRIKGTLALVVCSLNTVAAKLPLREISHNTPVVIQYMLHGVMRAVFVVF